MNLNLRHHTQVWLGLSEREVFPYLRAFAKDAKTGIDVGAAEGEFTLYFWSQPGMKHVLAFDASERFASELSANLALNGFEGNRHSTLITKYVSDHDDDNHCTLDALAATLEGPCVVKIDIEGSEAAALAGAAKLLERTDVSWIIETHSLELEKECARVLASHGLRTEVVRKAWWRLLLPEKRVLPHNQWLVGWRDRPATDA